VAISVAGRIHVLPEIAAPSLLGNANSPLIADADWVVWPLLRTVSSFDTRLEGFRALLQWWLHATRYALLATALIALVSSVIGTALGWLAAFGPRLVDVALRRAIEVTGALPSLVLVGVARVSGAVPTGLDVVLVLIVLRSFEAAQLVRALVIPAGEGDFVVAARAVGGSGLHILRWHLLPHLVRPLASLASTTLAAVIALEAALALVGLGVPAAQSSWGTLLIASANQRLLGATPIALLSVVATTLALTVLARQLQRDRWVQRHHL
jgi:peptide/nickel transport system permease protein